MPYKRTTLYLIAVLACGIAEAADTPSARRPLDSVIERAEAYSAANLSGKVLNAQITPHWIGAEDRFWFRKQHAAGHEFITVDAATGKQQPAFDHHAMALALAAASERQIDSEALPIIALEFAPNAIEVQLNTGEAPNINIREPHSVSSLVGEFTKASYRCELSLKWCEAIQKLSSPGKGELSVPAPLGREEVFVRDHNLWLRQRGGGREIQLTRDGVAHFAYGAWDEEVQELVYVAQRRAGVTMAPQWIQWAPDGRHLAAMRVDLRDTPPRPYLTEFASGRDDFMLTNTRRFPISGDRRVLDRVVTIVDTRTGQAVHAKIDPARLQDRAVNHFNQGYLWWNLEGQELYLVTASKDARRYGLVSVDMRSGAVRTVVEETERQHYIFTGADIYDDKPDFHVTANGEAAIWYSQRSGFGHLYLYDARTGKLKNPITQGAWVVLRLVRVDEAQRMIYFTAGGKEAGINIYYSHLYRISFDGGEAQLLTPEKAHHEVSSAAEFSPSGAFFVDSYSTLSEAPVTLIRRSNGDLLAPVIVADISSLQAMSWRPPQPFSVKAADRQTDLYGVMYTPVSFDPGKKYAVVENSYPGPQGSYLPKSFMEGLGNSWTQMQLIAELGFVAVFVEGRGSAGRDRAFRYAFLGTEDPFGAADHKAAIENLARQRPYMDAGRVGLIGGSYGGYAAARAALLYPEFFDVTVSAVGPHDYRFGGHPFAVERLFGSPGEPAEDYYHEISNTRLAHRLEGKLFLIYGELDENVLLNQYFLMADALIEAGKSFDSLIVPNADHQAGYIPYVRRRWMRYFVDHLGPPREAGDRRGSNAACPDPCK